MIIIASPSGSGGDQFRCIGILPCSVEMHGESNLTTPQPFSREVGPDELRLNCSVDDVRQCSSHKDSVAFLLFPDMMSEGIALRDFVVQTKRDDSNNSIGFHTWYVYTFEHESRDGIS